MRRSQSSSNIPMLTVSSLHNRRDSRSKSAVRYSRDPSLEGVTPLASRRIAPGDTAKKYSAQKNQLRTPTTPGTFSCFKRSSSLSAFSSRGSVARCIKSPAERKMLEKQQYVRLQEFIETSGLLNPELAGRLRPPTIAIFVEIVSVLLGQLIKTAPITLHNYTEVVLNTLKQLRYPGQLTTSTIKTVNTMHGWPQFLSIVTWLIERVDLQKTHYALRERRDEDEKATFDMHDAVFEYMSSIYVRTSDCDNQVDQEFLTECKDQFYGNMLRITETDQEAAEKLKQRLECERAEVAALDSKLQEIEEEKAIIQAQRLERQSVINKYEENKGRREQEVKEELTQLQKALSKCSENKASLVASIEGLEQRIAKQSCKYKDKTALLKQIEDLKRIVERKERKLSEYRLVRDELDMELKILVTQIESKVDEWNVFITKTFLPELKALRLREKGFHSDEFLQEIVHIHKEKVEVQEQLLKECKADQANLENLKKQKNMLMESDKALESTRAVLEDLKSSIHSLEEQNRTMRSDLDECERNHMINMKKIREAGESKVKEQEVTLSELNDRKSKMTKELDTKAQKNLAVLVESHNLAIQYIQKVEEQTRSMLGDAKEFLDESTKNLQVAFDDLLYLRANTEKLYQSRNGENK